MGNNLSKEDALRLMARTIADGKIPSAAGRQLSEGERATLAADAGFAAMVDEELVKRVRTYDAPKAFRVLRNIISNRDEKTDVKLRAAIAILNLAGYVAPKAPDVDKSLERTLADMPAADLRAFVAKAESELAGRAKPVRAKRIAPSGVQPPEEPEDMLG